VRLGAIVPEKRRSKWLSWLQRLPVRTAIFSLRLDTPCQGEPAPLHIQKVLLEPWISLSGGFLRALFGVFIAFANLLVQTLKHRSLRYQVRGRLVSQSPMPDGLSLVGDGAILRRRKVWRNATKACCGLNTLGTMPQRLI